MSWSARRLDPALRHVCPCGRRALYFSVASRRRRSRPDHPVCAQCWRHLRDRYRVVRRLPSAAARGRGARPGDVEASLLALAPAAAGARQYASAGR